MNGILALSDGWTIGLCVAQMIFNVVMGVGLAYVHSKSSEIRTLREKLESAADRRIDSRFASLGREMDQLVEPLRATIGALEKRLADGDDAFTRLGEKAHELELKLGTQIDRLKDWTREQAGSRSAQETIFEKLDGIAAQVNRLPCQGAGACPGGHREVV
jgi:chromosome segregation ATPase